MRSFMSSSRREKDEEKYNNEYSIYRESLKKWDIEAENVVIMRRTQVELTTKVLEMRDRLEPRDRLRAHLDHMYSILFDGLTVDNPEDDRLEWEIKCAVEDDARLSSLVEPSQQIVRSLTEAHKALLDLERYLGRAVEASADITQWFSSSYHTPEYGKVTGNLAFAKRAHMAFKSLLQVCDTNLSKSRENADESRRLELPEIIMLPTFEAGFSVSVDGLSVVACVPRSTLREEDVEPMIKRAHESTQLALQILVAELDSAQRRIDRLKAEMRRARDGLRTSKLALHTMRRAMFQRLATQTQAGELSVLSANEPSVLMPVVSHTGQVSTELPPAYS